MNATCCHCQQPIERCPHSSGGTICKGWVHSRDRVHRCKIFPAISADIAEPDCTLGLHAAEPEIDGCAEEAGPAHEPLVCVLSDAHDGPHFDPMEGHWQRTYVGPVELTRCPEVKTQ